LPAAGLWTYFTNDTCRPTTNPSDTCTLGYYPVVLIKAQTVAHIQAGINFARENNLRLIIRNTGHDFLGRSVGWGALVINTHGFKDITFKNQYRGCNYTGPAVTVGAGVQAFEVLKQANAMNPPKIMVTGECAVSTCPIFLEISGTKLLTAVYRRSALRAASSRVAATAR
jgi:hypothetical protein